MALLQQVLHYQRARHQRRARHPPGASAIPAKRKPGRPPGSKDKHQRKRKGQVQQQVAPQVAPPAVAPPNLAAFMRQQQATLEAFMASYAPTNSTQQHATGRSEHLGRYTTAAGGAASKEASEDSKEVGLGRSGAAKTLDM